MMASKAMKDPLIGKWCTSMPDTQPIINALTSYIAPHTFEAGCTSIKEIKSIQQSLHPNAPFIENVLNWPSVFSGISVISNRKTKYHTDKGGHDSVFDLLVSCGTHSNCKIKVPELKLSFSYNPGTIVAVNGSFLHHAVEEWSGGDRICYAHYMKRNVHKRTGVTRPQWQNIKSFKN